jgi:hypothetical protein
MKVPAIASLLLSLLVTGACGGGPVTKAPQPLRPKAEGLPPAPEKTEVVDCEPPNPMAGRPALTYGERSIPEADKLAKQGFDDLRAAESPGIDPVERERLITNAVSSFIDALLADPYNVHATYNLAAAYARIGREQCSINMLERLLQMRDHDSKHKQVEEKLDRLLGRNRQALDPDFADLRSNARFRDLIRDMCAGTDDPGCVHGK